MDVASLGTLINIIIVFTIYLSYISFFFILSVTNCFFTIINRLLKLFEIILSVIFKDISKIDLKLHRNS